MIVRDARGDEAAAIARFHQRVALFAYRDIFPPEAPPPTIEMMTADWETRLADPASRTFIAEQDGAMVGIAYAGRNTLERLYVEPDRWGEGIGRALYDRCLDVLSHNDVITLRVLEANRRVRAWYERLGWELTDERIPVYEPGGIYDAVYRFAPRRSTASSRRPA